MDIKRNQKNGIYGMEYTFHYIWLGISLYDMRMYVLYKCKYAFSRANLMNGFKPNVKDLRYIHF